MKTKITLLIAVLFLAFNFGFSQEEDANELSIMTEYAKAKNFDAAYQPFMNIRKRNQVSKYCNYASLILNSVRLYFIFLIC